MKLLKENLLVQFSPTSFAIIVVIALAISFALSTQLGWNIELLTEHGKAMMTGTMIEASAPYSISSLTNAVGDLRLMTFAAMAPGFLFLYLGLTYIVGRGWRTINAQRTALEQSNHRLDVSNNQLKVANDDLRQTQEKLLHSERLAAIGELSGAVTPELRNPLGGLSLGVDFVKIKVIESALWTLFYCLTPPWTGWGMT